jgi:tRNA nucleotidyltransferase (CCA-adding enzyme)
MIERYAEHPFLEFQAGKVRVNVVPCYKVDKGQWKSATDRSPFHTEYMQEKLTTALRLQARFLRKFMKGIHTYGAEIRVGGFSGMLVETLTLAYGSFLESLEQASDWKAPIFIRADDSDPVPERLPERLQSDLVVIDPVDPERNLAAAVTSSKLWTFVAAAREFNSNPGEWYFYPPRFKPKNKTWFTKKIQTSGFETVAISFKHPKIVVDVLWGQLRKLERSLVDLMERNDFRLGRSETWSDEKNESIILVEVENFDLPPVVRREGPPVSNSAGSDAFLERHFLAKDTVNGPWIGHNRWLVDKKRRINNIRDLIKEAVHDSSNTLVIPLELESSFRNSSRVYRDTQLLSLVDRAEFNQAFWEFLEAKPSWLRSKAHRSQLAS